MYPIFHNGTPISLHILIVLELGLILFRINNDNSIVLDFSTLLFYVTTSILYIFYQTQFIVIINYIINTIICNHFLCQLTTKYYVQDCSFYSVKMFAWFINVLSILSGPKSGYHYTHFLNTVKKCFS